MTERLFDLRERQQRILRHAQVLGNETTKDRFGSRCVLSRQRNFRGSKGNRLLEIPVTSPGQHRREHGVRFSEARQPDERHAGVIARVVGGRRRLQIQSVEERQSRGKVLVGNGARALGQSREGGRIRSALSGRAGRVLHEPVMREIGRQRRVPCRGELYGGSLARANVVTGLLRAESLQQRDRTHEDENKPAH